MKRPPVHKIITALLVDRGDEALEAVAFGLGEALG